MGESSQGNVPSVPGLSRLVRLAAGPSSGNALTADQTAQLQKFVSAVAGR